MRLNDIDAAILNVLLQDGRASFRDIAKKTSLSTPTVSYHYSRMVKSGLIRRFAPILDRGVIGRGVSAFVAIRTKAGQTDAVSRKLSSIGQISGLFVTSGENNILLRVDCADTRELQELLNDRLPRLVDGDVVSSQVIVDTVKDDQPSILAEDVPVRLSCDLCRGEIVRDRPYNVRVGSTHHYFCCRVCRKSYLEKYGSRIHRINARQMA